MSLEFILCIFNSDKIYVCMNVIIFFLYKNGKLCVDFVVVNESCV